MTPTNASPSRDAILKELARLHIAYQNALTQLVTTVAGMLPAIDEAGLTTQSTILLMMIDDINKSIHAVHDYAKSHAAEIGMPVDVMPEAPSGVVN